LKGEFEIQLQILKEHYETQIQHEIENQKKEWENHIQQFQHPSEINNPDQEEVIRLRFLFLQHLSHQHNFQKEEKEINYEFQSVLDKLSQNEEEYFETFSSFFVKLNICFKDIFAS
jgi:hypothetical protein